MNLPISRAVRASLVASLAFPAFAQEPAPEALETVYVLGAGETRQVQQVSSAQIDQLPAGTTALKAIEKLPGVNFQSADPFGAYEWSTRITVRGFNQNQMGFTLDGVPLGDMSYGNHNGLHVSRAAASENIASVQLAQGTGALSTASTSNLGGALLFTTSDPSRERGLRAEVSTGSEHTEHYFLRADSGQMATGTRVFASFVDHSARKWRGSGSQGGQQFTVKAVQDAGDATLTAYFNYSDRAETDYQDLSYDIIERRGYFHDNWYPNYAGAVAAADACAAAGYSDPVACDDSYWNAAGLRVDKLGYLKAVLPFAGRFTLGVTGYKHENVGQGLWGTPYLATPSGAPLTIRTTEYDIDRRGAMASLVGDFGSNTLEVGAWLEHNDFNQARRFYGEESRSTPSRSFYQLQRNPLLTQWEYAFETETTVVYVQDDIKLGNWRVNLGAKSVDVTNTARTLVGADKSGTIKAERSFLPQVGALYKVSDTHEVFGDISRNMRAFVSAGTAGPFGTSAAGFAAIKDTLQPELATTAELGWRYTTPELFGSLTVYHVEFSNRQLSIQQGAGIIGNPSVLANVGGVTTDGAELAIGWKPVSGVTWFNSLSYNDSTYDNDYTTNGVVVPVKGKQVPDAPEFMLRSELSFESGNWFGRVDGNYTGKRYYTYLNQGQADSYVLFNAMGGYRFNEAVSLQLDITNLFDERYISTVGSNGFVNADPGGTNQTLLTGAPRQVFVALKARL
ncbi:MAG: hypothetical protein RL026_2428 [Pseudomonadota bacterium]|jgi:iron complex outermembrane receptor protein